MLRGQPTLRVYAVSVFFKIMSAPVCISMNCKEKDDCEGQTDRTDFKFLLTLYCEDASTLTWTTVLCFITSDVSTMVITMIMELDG